MAVLFATLFIMPAAAFAAEAQTELLDPGTLTLTVDPYAYEEPVSNNANAQFQGKSDSVKGSTSISNPESVTPADSQTVLKDDESVVATPTNLAPDFVTPSVTEESASDEKSVTANTAVNAVNPDKATGQYSATTMPVMPRDVASPRETQLDSNDSYSDIAASSIVGDSDSSSTTPTTQSKAEPYEPNVVLVTPATMPNLKGAQALATLIGGVSLDASTYDVSDGFLRLSITDGSSVDAAIARIAKVQGVLAAQPNFLYRQLDEDAVTSVDDRWYLDQWGLFFSSVPQAWDYVQTGHSLAVAIIDTGAQLDHPDLAPNIVAVYNAVSSRSTVDDQLGHGTHVAGIVSGVANNSIGVAGVSYNANLVIIKASGYRENSFDTAALVRAFTWLESRDESGYTVAQHYNVRVVNMSVGGIDSDLEANLRDDLFHAAMLKARDEYGILTVTAAGNGSPKDLPYYTYPSDSYACLAVMNLAEVNDEDGNFVGIDLAKSSNYNPIGSAYKDLSAPGTDIHSTYLNGKYALLSGTSMAAPFVSGVAALVFAANPLLTPTQVQSILEASASDMGEPGWDEHFGYGAVNALAAVRLANTATINGWKVISWDTDEQLTASLGVGQGSIDGNWTWSLIGELDTMYATISDSGLLIGRDPGEVTVRATCTTTAGAQISQTMQVRVVKPEISDAESVGEGEVIDLDTGYDDLTWTWVVEDGTGHATIDQEGHLTGVTTGTVTVRAICANNTDIVAETTIDVTAALALAA